MHNAREWLNRLGAFIFFLATGALIAWFFEDKTKCVLHLRIFVGLSGLATIANGWSNIVSNKWDDVAKTEGMNRSLNKQVKRKSSKGKLRAKERLIVCFVCLVINVVVIGMLWSVDATPKAASLTWVVAIGYGASLAMLAYTTVSLLEIFVVDKFQSEINDFLSEQQRKLQDIEKISEKADQKSAG